MKKLLPLLLFFIFASCSKECEYGGDKAKVDQILTEIDDLEDERDNAPTEGQAEIYQKQIDRKKEELNEEMGKCS